MEAIERDGKRAEAALICIFLALGVLSAGAMRRLLQFRPSWGSVSLALLAALVFSPALGAGYLGYDDHWLIRDNTALAGFDAATFRAIFFDLSFENRIALGAEYLPIRDLFTLLMKEGLGLSPAWMHAVHLGLYLGAALLVRAILLALFGVGISGASKANGAPVMLAELSAILFAIHPAHAESVVWLAGSKDLLSLLFTALAVLAYIRSPRLGLASLFALLALFSKSTSVIIPALFLLVDLALRRPIRKKELALTALISVAAFALHLHVGGVVGMIAPPIADDFGSRVASVAVIFARYLGLSLFLHPHSVVYEVGVFGPLDLPAILSFALFTLLGGLAIVAARRGARLHLFALALFFIALAPVSQIFAPLQNRMADRYLLIAALGPILSFSAIYLALLSRMPRLRLPLVSILILLAAALGFERASSYADTETLFLEASIRAPGSALGPYQLGALYEAKERYHEAEQAYREAFHRSAPDEPDRRKAGNNWARMLFARGAIHEALAIYEALYRESPPSGRILYNLSRVRAAAGDEEGSEAALKELRERFPDYERERGTIPKSGPLADR